MLDGCEISIESSHNTYMITSVMVFDIFYGYIDSTCDVDQMNRGSGTWVRLGLPRGRV